MSRPSLPPRRAAIGSWPGGWTVRTVTMDDIWALKGTGIDPAYCIGAPVGYAALHNGRLAATGIVTWDVWGRAWCWYNADERVPTRIMHTCALEMLNMLRSVEEPHVRMIVNLSIDGAERWARRLEFAPDGELTHPWGPVYRCDLCST